MLARGRLLIEPNERNILLFPVSTEPSVCAGRVVLELHKATEVKHLSVRFLGKATIRTSLRETSGTTIELQKVLLEKPTKYEAGNHVFDFAFSVPSRTAHHFRLSYEPGLQRHSIVANAELSGFMGGQLKAEEAISLIPILVEQGESVPGLEMHVEEAIAELGPVALSIRSPQFCVSSVFQTVFRIACPPTDVTILEASIVLIEHVSSRHFSEQSQQWEKQPPLRSLLARFDASHPPSVIGKTDSLEALAEIGADKSWRLEHFARLPNGDGMRFSSPLQSVSPFRVEHELVFSLDFKLRGGQVQQLNIKRKVLVASCMSILPNLALPDYAEHDDSVQVDEQPRAFSQYNWGSRKSEKGFCQLTFEEALKDWHDQMPPSRLDEERVDYKVVPA